MVRGRAFGYLMLVVATVILGACRAPPGEPSPTQSLPPPLSPYIATCGTIEQGVVAVTDAIDMMKANDCLWDAWQRCSPTGVAALVTRYVSLPGPSSPLQFLVQTFTLEEQGGHCAVRVDIGEFNSRGPGNHATRALCS